MSSGRSKCSRARSSRESPARLASRPVTGHDRQTVERPTGCRWLSLTRKRTHAQPPTGCRGCSLKRSPSTASKFGKSSHRRSVGTYRDEGTYDLPCAGSRECHPAAERLAQCSRERDGTWDEDSSGNSMSGFLPTGDGIGTFVAWDEAPPWAVAARFVCRAREQVVAVPAQALHLATSRSGEV